MNEAHVHTSAASVAGSSRPDRIDVFTPLFHRRRVPLRRSAMGAAYRLHHRQQREYDFRAEGCGGADRLVDDGHQHRRLQVPARADGHSGAGDRRPAAGQRVAETVRDWGIAGGYFATAEDAAMFHDELAHMLLTQKVAFNSPVWFNVGCDRLEPNADGQNWHWDAAAGGVKFEATGYRNPQCSACFINAVEDSLESIMTLAKTEGMLFKWGSGTGTNLSARSAARCNEQVSGGGTGLSGPLSFMRGFDAFAGVIKSRRQDAPRGQDGDPERGSSRHRRLHRVQGQGGGEGASR